MNEVDLVDLFHQEMIVRGVPHTEVYLSINEDMLGVLQRAGFDVNLKRLEHLARICIANEWLEQTTADNHLNFLSLTDKGLKIAIEHEYKGSI